MSDESKKMLLVEPLADCPPEIGRALWCLEDARRRTRDTLKGMNLAHVDWSPPQGFRTPHTIGTLLYHIAAIEIDWFGSDVMENKLSPEVWEMFPFDVRDEAGKLTIVTGISWDDHWARLDKVRAMLLAEYRKMSIEDFRRPRHLPDYEVTPEWVLHHLCQHEAEHRSELGALRAAAENA
jgi:uncharacterized damage-inducible protein DinB